VSCGRGFPALAIRLLVGAALSLSVSLPSAAAGPAAPATPMAGPAAAPDASPSASPSAKAKPLFVPTRFLVGDEVEALVPLPGVEAKLDSGFELKPGSGLPQQGASADPVLRSVAMERTSQGWEARIRFVPWSPGPGVIPSISARGFIVPTISYNVSSSLGAEERDPAPPRPQREPPGTAVYLYGFAGLVLALVLGALGFAAYVVPAARGVLARWRAAQAFRRLRRVTTFLCRGLESTVPELFYAALARELRIYLAQRVEPLIPNLSSTELACLPESSFPAPGIRENAASLIAETERGRYSGELEVGALAAPVLRAAADRALALGAATEEAIDARL